MNKDLIINSAGWKITSEGRVFYSNGWTVNSTEPEDYTVKISKDKIVIKPSFKKD